MQITTRQWPVWLIAVLSLFSEGLFSQPPQKQYPPSQNDKYWFQQQGDLYFSEELTLPGYSDEELGRLEYPSIAVDSRRNVYVAYDYTSPGGSEAVYLSSFHDPDVQYEEFTEGEGSTRYLKFTQGPIWQGPYKISTAAGEEYRPRIAVDNEDIVWVVWSARRDGQWNIFVRTFSVAGLDEEVQLTSGQGYNFRPVVLAAESGSVWVAWERGTPEKHMHIVARYFQEGRWSEEIMVEARPGYAYRPALLETHDGAIWFAWDHTSGCNTDVYIRRFRRGEFEEPIRVSTHPAIDAKPALAWYDDRLWVAWTTNRRGENGWGIIRYPLIRAFDGRRWYQPVTTMRGIELEDRSETQSYEYPTLTFDAYGRLYLFTRHDHIFSAAYYEDGEWSSNWLLDEIGWGQRGFYVHSGWVSGSEMWQARRDRRTIYLQKMVRKNPQKVSVRLQKFTPGAYPDTLMGVAEDSFRGPTRHGNYQVYYGELHVHTAYSDGAGSFDELYNLYQNIYRLDFLAITDHDELGSSDFNHLSPGEWAYLKALNELYNRPGEFVTLNAYEWTHSTWSGRQDSSVKIGHKNVYFKGGEESPFFSHFSNRAYDARSLFQTLHDHEALAFPHHTAWGGITWEDHDPEIETNYEIVSIHGANEYMGNLPVPHRGGMPGTFAQDGLSHGVVVGFVGGSDSHGLYYHSHEGWREDPYKGGLTGVLLNGPLTRENVWTALKERRNYATSGEKYFLEFFIDGQPMGSIIRTDKPPTIAFRALSEKILYAYIIRDNREHFVTGAIGGSRWEYKGLPDNSVEPGNHSYYLRIVYRDGTVAWSSPIWVSYRPK